MSIALTVDGKNVEVADGATVLDAARKAGAWVPTLCYHEALGSFGSCRICTVEVSSGGRTRLQASCSLPASPGMVVHTASERVVRGRKIVAELMLARAPKVEAVKRLARELGVERIRFAPKDEDCILCGLCVRACAEIMGVGAIGFSGRGIAKKVETPFGGDPDACRACGACSTVCPTGRMQMEAERVRGFRELAGARRQCRYARMGFFSHKLCHNNYRCWSCEVDQSMEATLGCHPALAARPGRADDEVDIGGLVFAPSLYYHNGHTWAQEVHGRVRVGMDALAAAALGRCTAIESPPPGGRFDQGAPAFKAWAGKRCLDLALPVAGTVARFNEDLIDDPGVATRSPYARGWIAIVEPDSLRPDLTRLLHRHAAAAWWAREASRLSRHLASAGVAPGNPADGLASLLDDPAWGALAREFFATKSAI